MNRRTFVSGASAAAIAGRSGAARAQAAVPIADMHFHSFFGAAGHRSRYDSRPLGPFLAAGGATLVAWAAVGDLLWVDWKAYKQNKPIGAGEALAWLERETRQIRAHCREQGLRLALTAGDVDKAAAGEPHIVLALEGATFVETDAALVRRAFELGVRHLQLAHYIRNPLADIQTEPSEHKGLSALGKEVVAECNRLGILVDLAHCSAAAVQDALGVSRAPMVWSHGSVVRGQPAAPTAALWRRRQLPVAAAEAIAANGGAVGLWALRPDIGATAADYARRMLELAQLLGEDHVAFGSDINGLGPNALIGSYAELRQVVEHWRGRIAGSAAHKLAMGNYARVLKQAMALRRA